MRLIYPGLFGVPDAEDPDPYGVNALQEAGIEIRDAETHERASKHAFEFNPSPSSPIYASFNRLSIDSPRARAGSWRHSRQNSVSYVDTATQTEVRQQAEGGTQTEEHNKPAGEMFEEVKLEAADTVPQASA
jgi:hypothetical protein